MKIKLYIITYNNDTVLKRNLYYLYQSDLVNYNHEIFVINNYGFVNGFPEYPSVSFLNNVTRPDFSNGHLARNWNQGLINGFRDLNNPDCDLVILMQNDTFVKKDCFSKLIGYHNQYDFIQQGLGDQFMSFNVEAVKNIGIFDERFCSIGYQEGDYFLNALTLYCEKITLNDYGHGRIYNPLSEKIVYDDARLNGEFHSLAHHEYNLKLLQVKWGVQDPQFWPNIEIKKNLKPQITRYMFYPYFEKNILTLNKQKYFLN